MECVPRPDTVIAGLNEGWGHRRRSGRAPSAYLRHHLVLGGAGRGAAVDPQPDQSGALSHIVLFGAVRRDGGIKSRVVTVLLDEAEAVPPGSVPVYAHGRIAGKTTSAALGYQIARPLALAEIDATIGEGEPD